MADLAKEAEHIDTLETEVDDLESMLEAERSSVVYLQTELEQERIAKVGWMNKTLAERAKVQRYRTSVKRLVRTLRDGHEDYQLKCHKAAAWLEGLVQEDEANKTHRIGGEEDVAA